MEVEGGLDQAHEWFPCLLVQNFLGRFCFGIVRLLA